ncbi:hypothetical protein L917_03188 [Phytophthora nicotianae]|uniref:Uncharacterized protein n=1 Tax=Phytophthora nicotianae TaxID=4792 RepID=W2LRM3_PHYNI|nr:hypothetical protein L917_03188 [Phytophthora nicotianae]
MRELAARSHFAGNSKPVNSSSADGLYVATRPVHVSSVLRRSAKALKPPRCRGFSNPLSTPRAAVLNELQEIDFYAKDRKRYREHILLSLDTSKGSDNCKDLMTDLLEEKDRGSFTTIIWE